jgi:endonuclease/exonuclease/phosphatase (EEP) superfamily protein YafD
MWYVLPAGWVAFLLLRLAGADGTNATAVGLALTPYIGALGLALSGVVLGLGEWAAGGLLLAVALGLLALVLPRAVRSRQPPAGPTRMRILSVNLYLGRADPTAVVALAREHDVDVLSLQELSAEGAELLYAAGIADVLPHCQFEILEQSHGSGLAARHPLVKRDLAGPSIMAQPSALVDLPGTAEIEVVAVHPYPPVRPHGAANWRRELAGLPRPGEPVRVLAGDFNATVDHRALRRLGYRDAAALMGAGLRPTWGRLVQLDHILVDNRCVVTEFRVLPVPGSDHHAVLAEVALM